MNGKNENNAKRASELQMNGKHENNAKRAKCR